MIRLQAVSKRYSNGQQALVDLSVDIGVGEWVVLTGPSGGGKSTLLRLLGLHERPTSGRLIVGGTDLSAITTRDMPAYRRRVALVFQDHRLLPEASVIANVALPLVVAGYPRVQWRGAAEAMLERVGLSAASERMAQSLSGGERQLVALARALVIRPDVLLADEPVSQLDGPRAGIILDTLRQVCSDGTTVVMARHQGHGEPLGRVREIRLEAGRLVESRHA